jgi:DNA invertase Pin-like site-specific DNA recombinase
VHRSRKDASRRKFDVIMAWAIDRVGRSLIDLLGTIQALEACGIDLYLDQQALDTTTPAGKLMFQVCGAFAEFERSMIRQRIHAGLKRAVAQGKPERSRRAQHCTSLPGWPLVRIGWLGLHHHIVGPRVAPRKWS